MSTWSPRSAPMAIAVRSVSCALGGPAEKARMSGTVEMLWRSRRRMDSSRESSSKGFMDILTPAVSTAVCAAFTRGLT